MSVIMARKTSKAAQKTGSVPLGPESEVSRHVEGAEEKSRLTKPRTTFPSGSRTSHPLSAGRRGLHEEVRA